MGFTGGACGLALLALAPFALTAASPAPGASPAPSASAAARTLSVVCQRTPLWVFAPGNDRPSRAAQPQATLGQRFGLVSGPRSTLSGFQFYETDIAAVEPGLAGQHYWLSQACAIPS